MFALANLRADIGDSGKRLTAGLRLRDDCRSCLLILIATSVMESVSGWSLRFFSFLLWAAGISWALTITALLATVPAAALLRSSNGALMSLRSLSWVCFTAWLPLLPAGSLWWLALDQGTAKSALGLIKAWRLPGWPVLLWVKTFSRAMRACAFIATATLCGVVYANTFVANPVLRRTGSSSWLPVPMPLALPYGAAAALVVCMASLDRPVLAGMPQSRAARLSAQMPAALSLTGIAWALAGAVAACIYVLTPASFSGMFDSALAAAGLYCYTLCVVAAAHLAGIVMAERPLLEQYDAAGPEGSSLVRVHFHALFQHEVSMRMLLSSMAAALGVLLHSTTSCSGIPACSVITIAVK